MKVKVIYDCYFNQGTGDITGYCEDVTRYITIPNKKLAETVARARAKSLCLELATEKGCYCAIGKITLVFNRQVIKCEEVAVPGQSLC